MHPVSRLLAERFGSSDRRMLAASIARCLEDAGLHAKPNHIYRLIDQGHCNARLTEWIATALDPDTAARFRSALAGSTQPSPAIGRMMGSTGNAPAESCPHLWILHERTRPKALFIVALTGLERWKRIPLPEAIGHQTWPEQRRGIRQAASVHFRSEGRRDGLFGRAVGYLYRPTPEHSYRVTPGGRLDSLDLGPFREPGTRYTLRLKGR